MAFDPNLRILRIFCVLPAAAKNKSPNKINLRRTRIVRRNNPKIYGNKFIHFKALMVEWKHFHLNFIVKGFVRMQGTKKGK